jgi:hypothetical protein
MVHSEAKQASCWPAATLWYQWRGARARSAHLGLVPHRVLDWQDHADALVGIDDDAEEEGHRRETLAAHVVVRAACPQVVDVVLKHDDHAGHVRRVGEQRERRERGEVSQHREQRLRVGAVNW